MTAGLILLVLNLLFPFVAAAYLVYFFSSPRRRLLKKLGSELPERFAFYGKLSEKNCFWFHAASVGETRSLKPLVAALRSEFPETPIITTSSTAAGKAEAEKTLKPDLALLAPLDFYPFCLKFIRTFKPARLFVAEADFWPNMLLAAKNNGVPCALINGRISEKSEKRYSFIKPLAVSMLGGFEFASVQRKEDADRLESLGVAKEKIFVSGNTKYDVLTEPPPHSARAREIAAGLGWSGHKILACGSTHPEDETAAAEAFREIKKRLPVKLVMAPRHLERTAQTAEILRRNGLACAFLSERLKNNFPGEADCILVDLMGWLTSFYAAADVCFVGGTISPKGGHNLLEAAVLGKPVLFGPSTQNSPEEASALIKAGGFQVTQSTLRETAEKLLSDDVLAKQAGQKNISAAGNFTGATGRIMELIRGSFAKA